MSPRSLNEYDHRLRKLKSIDQIQYNVMQKLVDKQKDVNGRGMQVRTDSAKNEPKRDSKRREDDGEQEYDLFDAVKPGLIVTSKKTKLQYEVKSIDEDVVVAVLKDQDGTEHEKRFSTKTFAKKFYIR